MFDELEGILASLHVRRGLTNSDADTIRNIVMRMFEWQPVSTLPENKIVVADCSGVPTLIVVLRKGENKPPAAYHFKSGSPILTASVRGWSAIPDIK